MSSSESARAAVTRTTLRPRGIAPAIALLILAPFVGELLSGATRISFIIAFVPEVMVWGCGALLIRELVVRWRGGWTSMLLLGLALAVAEEFIIQQTSIAPLPWPGASSYGRAWGVNWVYFLYMLGYESVWVVLVPVQLTYLIFPKHRTERWLRGRGLILAGIFFLLGAYMAWFAWTQRARPVAFHAPKYVPPAMAVVSGLLMIVLLATAAWLRRGVAGKEKDPAPNTPTPWLVAIGVVLLGMPWWLLLSLLFIPHITLPAVVPFSVGVVWAALTLWVIRRWSSGAQWSDTHRLTLVGSAILVCMAGGFAGSSGWPRMDLVGKVALNAITVVGLFALGRRFRRVHTR